MRLTLSSMVGLYAEQMDFARRGKAGNRQRNRCSVADDGGAAPQLLEAPVAAAAHPVGRVTPRILAEEVLVIILGGIELGGARDLGDHRLAQLRLHLAPRLLRLATLVVVEIV